MKYCVNNGFKNNGGAQMKRTVFIAAVLFLTICMLFNCDTKSPTGDRRLSSVTDIDGNTYQIIKICDQWWMAENLRVTHYRNGDSIPNVTVDATWAELGDVITGSKLGRTSNDEITVFDSTGLAIQDAATVELVYEKAISRKIGSYIKI